MPGNVLYPVPMYPTGSPLKAPGDISGGGGSGGGIMDILRAANPPQINQPQVNPGMDAQGNPTFDVTPASIGGGFMNHLLAGRQGQMQVNQINAQLQAARLAAMAELANTRTRGEQERKTHITDAQIMMLQKLNLMPKTTPDGQAISADLINSVAGKTEQPGLDAAGANANASNVVAQNNLQTLMSPQGQKALTDSSLGSAMMPAFAAQKASTVSAAPGETVAYNNANNLTAGTPDLLKGATSSSQSFTPMQVPTRDASGKITGFGVQTFPTGSMTQQPGGLQQQIDPAILQQAQQLQPLMAPPASPLDSLIRNSPATKPAVAPQDPNPVPTGQQPQTSIDPNTSWILGQTLKNAVMDAPQNLGLSDLYNSYQQLLGQPFANLMSGIGKGISQ